MFIDVNLEKRNIRASKSVHDRLSDEFATDLLSCKVYSGPFLKNSEIHK